MLDESAVSSQTYILNPNCTFCRRDLIIASILKETPNFRILADHAPLVEGHLLIVPRNHYACYGAVPSNLDNDLFALRAEVQRFFARYYEPAVFWEHGVFHQTVFHAHLHCFPFGETHYDPSLSAHELKISSQEDIRTWYTTRGQYFYLEDIHNAFLFTPQEDTYRSITQNVLRKAALARNPQAGWMPSKQRIALSEPFIQNLRAKWQAFQAEEQNAVAP